MILIPNCHILIKFGKLGLWWYEIFKELNILKTIFPDDPRRYTWKKNRLQIEFKVNQAILGFQTKIFLVDLDTGSIRRIFLGSSSLIVNEICQFSKEIIVFWWNLVKF